MNFHSIVSSVMVFFLTRCGGFNVSCDRFSADLLHRPQFLLDVESLPKSIVVTKNEKSARPVKYDKRYVNLQQYDAVFSVVANKEVYLLKSKNSSFTYSNSEKNFISDFDCDRISMNGDGSAGRTYACGDDLSFFPLYNTEGALFNINDPNRKPGEYRFVYNILYNGKPRKLALTLRFKQTDPLCCQFDGVSGLSQEMQEVYCKKISYLDQVTTNIPGIVAVPRLKDSKRNFCVVKNSALFVLQSDQSLSVGGYHHVSSIPHNNLLWVKWAGSDTYSFEGGRWSNNYLRLHERYRRLLLSGEDRDITAKIDPAIFFTSMSRELLFGLVEWESSSKKIEDKIIEFPYLEDGKVGHIRIAVRYVLDPSFVPLSEQLKKIKPGVYDQNDPENVGRNYLECDHHYEM